MQKKMDANIITVSFDVNDFLDSGTLMTSIFASHKEYHLIIDMSRLPPDNINWKAIEKYSQTQKPADKSLVCIVSKQAFNMEKNPDTLNIVTTEQEAFDIIELECIERDFLA